MKFMSRLAVHALVALTLLVAMMPRHAVAQSTDLSQQMQLFNSLSPDQQQAIMQRLTGGGSGGTGMSSGSSLGGLGGLGGGLGGSLGMSGMGLGGNSSNNTQMMILQQMQQQQQRRQEAIAAGDLEPLIPVFKAKDTVLVEIELLQEVPAGTLANNQNQQGAQANQPGGASSPSAAQPSLTASQLAQFTQLSQNGQTLPFGQAASNNQRLQEGPQRTIEELQAEEKLKLEDLIDLIKSHNPYELDLSGNLQLPGIRPIAIAGLTEDLATRRVGAERAFDKIYIRLTRLPLTKTGQDALKPFGYDLFDNSMLQMSPVQMEPVPGDYSVGPGDVLQVQMFGNTNQMLTLTVGKDGIVNFPQLGPMSVGGQRFESVKSTIEARVAREMMGARASVSMNNSRSVTVFVLGETRFPGVYLVPAQGTVTSALFAATGVKKDGSLRDILVKRRGGKVATLDLYDLLTRGDDSHDARLSDGDVVFVPPTGSTASADGEVKRPAIYEIRVGETVGDLMRLAGGLTVDADRENAALTRVDDRQRRIVINIDTRSEASLNALLRNGDQLHVSRLRPQMDSGVTLQGHVYRAKKFAWRPGLRLTDVVSSLDELMPGADQNYLLVRRELPPNRKIGVVSADLAAALRAPHSSADIALMPRDTITVFDLSSRREYVMRPLMDELRLESTAAQPTEVVHIDGRVRVPGDYPLEPGMRISGLLRAGGSLDPAAYIGRAELSRYTVQNGEQRQTKVIPVDLEAVRAGNADADLLLEPFDRLSVQQISEWTEQDQVTLKGEVRFPGIYSIKPGDTLRTVIDRAGGLTQYAFPQGCLFTRVELKDREQEQLDRLAERMRTDIAESAMIAARGGQGNASAAVSIGESLLTQLKTAKAMGRLVINLPGLLRGATGGPDDVILRNGDELLVPKQRQDVMVLGEVQDPTSHLYHVRETRDDYVAHSGGPTRQADVSHIYVVRADGSVVTGNHGWFHGSDTVTIRPGDAIVVPLNTERLPPLFIWQSVSAILYNIAIATATARQLGL